MSRLIASARGLFRRHPFVTNSAIYGSLYVGAEYSQQYVSKRWLPAPKEREDIDYTTVGRYAVMGTAIYAPTLYACKKLLSTCLSFKSTLTLALFFHTHTRSLFLSLAAPALSIELLCNKLQPSTLRTMK
ncbi:uncharacterized protein LOC117787060 isoform X3 [Drosophila innubila]|uniref:uncharacterized protein LOC117787060 isoform X3 n=1 Tax=Drosophila innubila TaxID=198719 RepID=UPI00148B7970|nr:uncharacterized protein LOC117787060 isoform X3 [Drosophila innubila]